MPEGQPLTRALLVTDIIDRALEIVDRGQSAQALLTAVQNWPHSEVEPDRANLDLLLEATHSHAMQAEEQAIQQSLNIMAQLARFVPDETPAPA